MPAVYGYASVVMSSRRSRAPAIIARHSGVSRSPVLVMCTTCTDAPGRRRVGDHFLERIDGAGLDRSAVPHVHEDRRLAAPPPAGTPGAPRRASPAASYAMPMPIPSAPSSNPRPEQLADLPALVLGVAARSTALSRGSSLPVSCITAMRAGNSPAGRAEVDQRLALPAARYQAATGETPTSISSAVVTPSRALKR